MEWREAGGVEWLEARLPGARVAFSTRGGGVSEPPYDSLNLGILTADEPDRAIENRRRLAGALDIPAGRIVFGRQVHGADLKVHEIAPNTPLRSSFASNSGKERRGLGAGEVDGHVVSTPGVAALVFVADCLPVALVGSGGAAMLHCGWRGLAAGIVKRGAAAVEATDAAIGPGIGPCCYAVGDEVLGAFAGLGEGVAVGRMLDLAEVARRQLREAGVKRIESAGLCTSCEADRFFSHRRDAGRSGRQAGLVWIEAG
jgi:polyphenol oxidase